MSVTIFDFCTRAAISLGGQSISSFDDDSREAEVFSNIWQPELRTCLALGNWNFASRDFDCSRYPDAPEDKNYDYQFTLPADYLRNRFAMDANGSRLGPGIWTVQGNRVLSKTETLRLKYVRRYDEADLYLLPDWFGDLFTAKLAYRAAEPLTGKTSIRESARVEFEQCLIRARRADSQDQGPGQAAIAKSSWWESRRGGSV